MTSTDVNVCLHKILTLSQIEQIFQIFSQSKNQELTEYEFRTELFKHFYLSFSKEEFHTVFLQINQKRNGRCDWNEFVSYLLYKFECDDESVDKDTSVVLPISSAPIKKYSHHSYPIIGIRYYPVVKNGGVVLNQEGRILTTSKDGTINTWDMNFQLKRTDRAVNPELKVAKTWVVDFVIMPDVEIICTASIERDLRFYDIAADGFQLRMVISAFRYAINRLDYWFDGMNEPTTSASAKKPSKLILGDFGGNIFLIEFNTEHRGPFAFHNDAGSSYTHFKWKDVLKGKIGSMKIQEFRDLHDGTINQVNYCRSMDSIFSAAEYDALRSVEFPPGLIITNLGIQRTQITFRMPRGVSCFAINDGEGKKFRVATGSSDCVLRLWHHSIPDKPTGTLKAHQSGIVYIFVQDNGAKIYSLDRSRCVKIWDSRSEVLLQTYDTFQSLLSNNPVVAYYHDPTRNFIVANISLAYCTCYPLLDLNTTDGYTHSKSVSVVLYNELFNTVISCGLDSCILIWNPSNGKMLRMIRGSHIRTNSDQILNVEITAASLDPSNHFLITGAEDGSLKVWSLINGSCIRKLNINTKCKIISVYWFTDRIKVASSDNKITDFSVDLDNEMERVCELFDGLEIVSMACELPNLIAINDTKGGITVWDVSTEQLINNHNVNNLLEMNTANCDINENSCSGIVSCMILLASRSVATYCGKLFVALTSGLIQVFSCQGSGNYLHYFDATHYEKDFVTAMTTDKANRYLFTTTLLGYLKTWLIENYFAPTTSKTESWALLRLEFPFLSKDLIDGQAKKCAKTFDKPILVNSYRAHLKSINSIVYIDESKLLITGSADFTVRMWTLNGRYIRTFGSPNNLDISLLGSFDDFEFKLPPDIKGVASKTTLKVLNGGKRSEASAQWIDMKRAEMLEKNANEEEIGDNHLYGRALSETTLNRAYSMPVDEIVTRKPVIKITNSHCIPVFKHLKMYPADIVKMPEKPIILENLQKGKKQIVKL